MTTTNNQSGAAATNLDQIFKQAKHNRDKLVQLLAAVAREAEELWQASEEMVTKGGYFIPEAHYHNLEHSLDELRDLLATGLAWGDRPTSASTPATQDSAPSREALSKALKAASRWADASYAHAANIGKGGPGLEAELDKAETSAREAITALATPATGSPIEGAAAAVREIDLSRISRYTMHAEDGRVYAEGDPDTGKWVKLSDVQALLATAPAPQATGAGIKTWQERLTGNEDEDMGSHFEAMQAEIADLRAALALKQQVVEYEQRHAAELESALAEARAALAQPSAEPVAIREAVEAMKRAKKLPVWDELQLPLHKELDIIFRALDVLVAVPAAPAVADWPAINAAIAKEFGDDQVGAIKAQNVFKTIGAPAVAAGVDRTASG